MPLHANYMSYLLVSNSKSVYRTRHQNISTSVSERGLTSLNYRHKRSRVPTDAKQTEVC